MTDYRAEFDAEVTFLNGGGLQAQELRLDIRGPDVSEPELAAAFVRQLGLLITDQVRLSAVRILQEPHKGRKAFAGTAPVTRSSGLRTVVVARAACNQRLVDACYLWAFAALTASPGARRCYDAHRARGASHHQALRALGNRLVGILHGCLAQRVAYQEQLAWPAAAPAA
jgi:hypothetical protein